MKDSHIYQRMNNPLIMKGYINLIRTFDMETVKNVFDNIEKEANDHPRFPALEQAYRERLDDENNKE